LGEDFLNSGFSAAAGLMIGQFDRKRGSGMTNEISYKKLTPLMPET